MNILWTVNTLMPEVANELGIKSMHSLSWVNAMSKRLKNRKSITLAIACKGKGEKIQKHTLNDISYYILPHNCHKKDYWQIIIDDFRPDIIHAYGTESNHNLLLLKNHKDIPIVISLQGILSEYVRHIYAGLDFCTMLKYTQLIDFVLPLGFFSRKRNYEKRSKIEKKMLCAAKYVEGRSTWDRVAALRINPQLEYFYCPRMIRQPFFEYNWDINQIEKFSIFVHQAHSPIKGLHFVLEALFLLKERYPQIKLYIGGNDIFNPHTIKERIKTSGYIHYLKDLIKKWELKENIIITGYMSAEELAKRLTKTHVAVIPSSIENAPNSLAESMLVGTPTIASFVGGNMEMLEHEKDGFLYCYNEPNMLAEYINRFFMSPDLAKNFSTKAKDCARKRHDPCLLENQLMNIYNDILKRHSCV